jgi:ParB-like chromosome segregation protein Spo0J
MIRITESSLIKSIARQSASRRFPIDRIHANPRNRVYRRKVAEYRARLRDGETLEPIDLHRVAPGRYMIEDGHHRHEAHALEGRKTIRARVVIS